MKGKYNCPYCGGEGSYYMERDLHRSGGVVPCGHDPDKLIIKSHHQERLRIRFPFQEAPDDK